MPRFARNIAIFRVNGGSAAEKSWLACATVAGVVALPWNLGYTSLCREDAPIHVPFVLIQVVAAVLALLLLSLLLVAPLNHQW
jgi:hypothetical protein